MPSPHVVFIKAGKLSEQLNRVLNLPLHKEIKSRCQKTFSFLKVDFFFPIYSILFFPKCLNHHFSAVVENPYTVQKKKKRKEKCKTRNQTAWASHKCPQCSPKTQDFARNGDFSLGFPSSGRTWTETDKKLEVHFRTRTVVGSAVRGPCILTKRVPDAQWKCTRLLWCPHENNTIFQPQRPQRFFQSASSGERAEFFLTLEYKYL